MWLIGIVRVFLLCLLLVFALVAGQLSGLWSKSFFLSLAARWHGWVLSVLGIRVVFSGSPLEQGALVVSNHVSWLDISLIGSRSPVVFLAKREIASWPLVGRVVRNAGTLFIDRGNGAPRAIREISELLPQGQSVCLFPEGRTTDGSAVSRFQPRLFQAAIDCDAPVQPVTIGYRDRHGQRTDRTSYVGNASFLGSLWKIARCRGLVADIHFLDPFATENGRDAAARRAMEAVQAHLDADSGPV